jgi:hypothetical protein
MNRFGCQQDLRSAGPGRIFNEGIFLRALKRNEWGDALNVF